MPICKTLAVILDENQMTQFSSQKNSELDPLSKLDNRLITAAITSIVIGFFIIVTGVIIFFHKETLSNEKIDASKFGDFGSFISGAVGVLWTLVSSILFYVALRLQRKELSLQRKELELTRKELKTTSEANQSIAEDNKAKAILDLYQAYITKEFREKRQRAWNVLRMCITNKDYSDYVIMHFFPVFVKEKSNREITGDLIVFYKKMMKKRFPLLEIDTDDKAKQEDREDRHSLDDFSNFFNLLALRKSDREIETFKSCEFFYDHWRPLLWFMCDQREKYFSQNEIVKKYSRQVDWQKMLLAIDEFYGYEKYENRNQLLHYIKTHPILAEFEIDSRHDFMQ